MHDPRRADAPIGALTAGQAAGAALDDTPNRDAILHEEAAEIPGFKPGTICRFIRHDILHRVPGQHPKSSKAEVEEQVPTLLRSEWKMASGSITVARNQRDAR